MLELFVSDTHFPEHDPASWAIFLKVAEHLQPDLIWLGGDIIDCYAVSDHDKDPARAHGKQLQADFDIAHIQLTRLRTLCPNADITYKEGNHETRFTRYLWKKAKALSGLRGLTIPSNLDLASLDIKWVKNFDKRQIGRLWHIHGNEIAGGGMNPAASKMRRMNVSFIFGHHHTQNSFITRQYDEKTMGAWANPCMCLLNVEYVHHTDNWSHGFALIEYSTGGFFHVEQIPIIHKSANSRWCMVRGKEFSHDKRKR